MGLGAEFKNRSCGSFHGRKQRERYIRQIIECGICRAAQQCRAGVLEQALKKFVLLPIDRLGQKERS